MAQFVAASFIFSSRGPLNFTEKTPQSIFEMLGFDYVCRISDSSIRLQTGNSRYIPPQYYTSKLDQFEISYTIITSGKCTSIMSAYCRSKLTTYANSMQLHWANIKTSTAGLWSISANPIAPSVSSLPLHSLMTKVVDCLKSS